MNTTTTASGAAPALPTDAMIHAAAHAYDVSQATPLVKMRCAISAALARQEAAQPADDGYATAFYEIASVLGIGARADTPENVFRNEMLPKIAALASREASPALLTETPQELERALGQAIDERDERDEVIDALCDAVLGKDRPEWSSMYGFRDAVNDVEEHMAALASPQVAPAPEPVVKFVPVSAKLRDANYNHPKDTEPRTEACREALRLRGDDEGQGLDSFWTWGFAAGFNAALAAPVQVAPASEPEHSFTTLKKLMHDDPEYAWGWHCNLAMPVMDAIGVSAFDANEAGARLMRHLFDVDIWAMYPDRKPAAPTQPGAAADDARLQEIGEMREMLGNIAARVLSEPRPLEFCQKIDAELAALIAPRVAADDARDAAGHQLLSELAGIDTHDVSLRDHTEAWGALERYDAAVSTPAAKPAEGQGS